MTIKTKGMGAIIKKLRPVGKKARKERLEYLKGQRNIYKKDPTGRKDKIISQMNETLKKKKHSAGPGMIDFYHNGEFLYHLSCDLYAFHFFLLGDFSF